MALSLRNTSLQFKMLIIVAAAFALSLAVSIFALSRVYGSIQELAGFDRPEWLDMLPQRG